MRGDSLRDFYAKSLALMGLALLGAVGAVVDYWPTGFSVPRAMALVDLPQVLPPLSADNISQVVATAPVAHLTPVRFTASIVEPTPAVYWEPVSTVTSAPIPEAPPPSRVAEPPAIVVTPDEPVIDSTPDVFTNPFRSTTIAPPASPGTQQRAGFLAGAKRLPGAILHNGAKVGLIVGEAAQTAGGAVSGAVGGAFKKLFGVGS